MECRGNSPLILNLRYLMELSGQVYAPATFPKHPLEGSWVGPSANPNTAIKIKILAGAKD